MNYRESVETMVPDQRGQVLREGPRPYKTLSDLVEPFGLLKLVPLP